MHNIDENDHSIYISLLLDTWKDSGAPSRDLVTLFKEILSQDADQRIAELSQKYWRIHKKLTCDHFLDHDEARAFLSHSRLIFALIDNNLSAAQCAKLLKQRDQRVRFNRQNIYDFLHILGMEPKVAANQIKEFSAKDSVQSEIFFADADSSTAAQYISEIAKNLGYPHDIYPQLTNLYHQETPTLYTPYIQILHFQCCIAELYDHASTDLYEFAPRGSAANWLFQQYPECATGAGNPFLNNAKSVERISPSWVRSKKRAERPGAAALLQLLEGLETMGFAARRELAKLLRMWIWRILQLSTPNIKPLPSELPTKQWLQLLARTQSHNTESLGIIEQRVVDAICKHKYDNDTAWRSRGIGDAVCTTNISQKKFGDCDFQNAITRNIKAYESHAGLLTRVYIEDHIRTLKKSIALRADELSGIADISEWQADIIFIAHNICDSVTQFSMNLHGLNINFTFSTFKDFIRDALQTNIPTSYLDQYILSGITKRATPESVRYQFRKLITK